MPNAYKFCGVSCLLISVWAIVQLALMGVFYKIEAVVLIEDVEPHDNEFDGYEDYMKVTKKNYESTAINCWIAAGMYVITLILALLCLRKAKTIAELQEQYKLDDERSCQQPAPKEPGEERKKKKLVLPPIQ